MDSIKLLAQVAGWAGPLALACFGGTLLGGIALSFFWKAFGPWQLLKECKAECDLCKADREVDRIKHAELEGKMADLAARFEILKEAVNKAGLGLQLGPKEVL